MNSSRFFLFVFLGILFWLNAVLLIRWLGPHLMTANNPYLIFAFLLVIPVTLLTIWIIKLISKLPYSQLLKPMVIMTFTATTFDGIALLWFRHIYSESVEIALHGAALIIWGAGLGLMIAYYLEQRANPA